LHPSKKELLEFPPLNGKEDVIWYEKAVLTTSIKINTLASINRNHALTSRIIKHNSFAK